MIATSAAPRGANPLLARAIQPPLSCCLSTGSSPRTETEQRKTEGDCFWGLRRAMRREGATAVPGGGNDGVSTISKPQRSETTHKDMNSMVREHRWSDPQKWVGSSKRVSVAS